MAKAFLGGGLFLLDSIISSYALQRSAEAPAGPILMIVLGAMPLAYYLASSVFSGGVAPEAEAVAKSS